MIDDPIVIRKSRGALVVSSSISTDPIQLVRQVSATSLEVHLKNNHKYIEDIREGENIYELILEMMGYTILELSVVFNAWPESYEGTMKKADQKAITETGKILYNEMFSETPYLNSKFLGATFSMKERRANNKYYDSIYSNYDCFFSMKFRGRIDMLNEIQHAAHGNGSTLKGCIEALRRDVLANDFSYSIKVDE